MILGKDIHGKSLGKGLSQRKDGRYEARAIINGYRIHLYNMSLTQIRKDFEIEKAKVIRNEINNWSNITLHEWFIEWFKAYKEPKLKGGQSTQIYLRNHWLIQCPFNLFFRKGNFWENTCDMGTITPHIPPNSGVLPSKGRTYPLVGTECFLA